MLKAGKLIVIAGIISFVFGCKKSDEYSDTPVIAFKSITLQKNADGYDEIAHLVVSFTDGDGDIGYNSSGNGALFDDSASKYYNNFKVSMDELHAGNWETDTAHDYSGRMPYLTPSGNNKALKGDIEMAIFLPFFRPNDTIRYNVFIYDRALHQSNTITTPQTIIHTN
jgi:hypothetical protein